MSKGDFVNVYVRKGIDLEIFRVEARQAGRKIELETTKTDVTASEVTRGGTLVRKVEFPRSEVVAIESEISE